MWQLSSPSPFYSPPSPRRVVSRVKTLSNCLTRSCSLLRVRQKGQRGPERDDERGRDGGGGGLEQGMPTELSHAAIRGLLTHHHWSRTETNAVERSGHKRSDSHTTEVSKRSFRHSWHWFISQTENNHGNANESRLDVNCHPNSQF